MGPEHALLHSQEHATCPSPQTDQSSPYPHSHSLKIHLNIILPSTLKFSKCPLFLRIPTKRSMYLSPFVPFVPSISFFI